MNENKKLKLILKYIGNDKLIELDAFVNEVSEREFTEFSSLDAAKTFFIDYLATFYDNNSTSDINIIRAYTGIAFRYFNSVLRGYWNYEMNGLLNTEKKNEYLSYANKLSECIEKTTSLSSNIKTYRGVSLDSFKDYGITSLEDLNILEGKYYFESGFTSTSLIRNKSFFNKELEFHEHCNIEIEYLIPVESNDGIPLIDNNLSYSNLQGEYLINKSSLVKIIDIKIDSDAKLAYMKVVLIPLKMWNITYNKNNSLGTSKTI